MVEKSRAVDKVVKLNQDQDSDSDLSSRPSQRYLFVA